jgi:hypothetical protein
MTASDARAWLPDTPAGRVVQWLSGDPSPDESALLE